MSNVYFFFITLATEFLANHAAYSVPAMQHAVRIARKAGKPVVARKICRQGET